LQGTETLVRPAAQPYSIASNFTPYSLALKYQIPFILLQTVRHNGYCTSADLGTACVSGANITNI
jgi:hypothetical protein